MGIVKLILNKKAEKLRENGKEETKKIKKNPELETLNT